MKKKLKLQRKTIQPLQPGQLRHVEGGGPTNGGNCGTDVCAADPGGIGSKQYDCYRTA